MKQSEDFLKDHPTARPFNLPDGFGNTNFIPVRLLLGKGSSPLEIAVFSHTGKPKTSELRRLWLARHNNRAAILVAIVLYQDDKKTKAIACGFTGDKPPILKHLSPEQWMRISECALLEPNKETALSFLERFTDEQSAEHFGIYNNGMFSQHVFEEQLNKPSNKKFWVEAAKGIELLAEESDQDKEIFLQALGYEIGDRIRRVRVLRTKGERTAIGLILMGAEQPDVINSSYYDTTPISVALEVADSEKVGFVLVVRGGSIRLYSAEALRGRGRQGRTDTFIEADVRLLPAENMWWIQMLFGPLAVHPGSKVPNSTLGMIDQSRLFASQIGVRLRDRIYEDVFPELAAIIGRHVDAEGEDRKQLDHMYEVAMTILFRLLFIAYAEDQQLLSFRTNFEYQQHSLKQRALFLTRKLRIHREPCKIKFEPTAFDYWDDVLALFRAIDTGNVQWGIPLYNGGMFSSDPSVNRVGAEIEGLKLSNADIGPILAALLVDEIKPGRFGPVDFRQLAAREFGTIYEGLLESQMQRAQTDLKLDRSKNYVEAEDGDEAKKRKGEIFLIHRSGVRKSTGTYYTPEFAVEHLLEHALEPAISDHLALVKTSLENHPQTDLARGGGGAAALLFSFSVADIAMGSGHFLVAAVDRIERRFRQFLDENPIDSVEQEIQTLGEKAKNNLGSLAENYSIDDTVIRRRLIAMRCVYGIDINPLAVELARLAVWTHTFVPGLPLSNLDGKLITGDSLIGIGTLEEAMQHQLLKKSKTASWTEEHMLAEIKQLEPLLKRRTELSDQDEQELEVSRDLAKQIKERTQRLSLLFDSLVANRIAKKPQYIVTLDDVELLDTPELEEFRNEYRPIHFPTVFPQVFLGDTPGFNCLVGNPPWEKIKMEELLFWITKLPGLRALKKPERESKQKKYRETYQEYYEEYLKKRQNKKNYVQLILKSPQLKKGSGDTDMYHAYIARVLEIAKKGKGFIGIVTPEGVLTGASNIPWRRALHMVGGYLDITRLTNTKGIFHQGIDKTKLIALISLGLGSDFVHRDFPVRGPCVTQDEYQQSILSYKKMNNSQVKDFPDNAVPRLPTVEHYELVAKMLSSLPISRKTHSLRVRPIREFDSTNDKKMMSDEEELGNYLYTKVNL